MALDTAQSIAFRSKMMPDSPYFCPNCKLWVALDYKGCCPKCKISVLEQHPFLKNTPPKNYNNTNLLIAKLWQTYLLAKPEKIGPIHVEEMLELKDFAHFIIKEISEELEGNGTKYPPAL